MLASSRSMPASTNVLLYVCLILIVAVLCLLPRSCDSDETLYTPAPLTVMLQTPKSVDTFYPSKVDSVRHALLVDSLERYRRMLKAAGVTRRIIYDTIITVTHAGTRYDDSATVHVDDIQRTVSLHVRSSPRVVTVSRQASLFAGGDLTYDLQRFRPRAVLGYRFPIDDRIDLCAQVETLLDGDIVRAYGSVGFRITL